MEDDPQPVVSWMGRIAPASARGPPDAGERTAGWTGPVHDDLAQIGACARRKDEAGIHSFSYERCLEGRDDVFGYGLWVLVVNSLIFIIFARFFHPRSSGDWRTLGGFAAFVAVLFTEMGRLL